ncbi:MAG TPA: MBL fold metallo-hydrolase [Catenuloplanes sp.]|jgi:cyclase
MREVEQGVFGFLQGDGGWCVNNAGLVVGAETAVLIDTAATERRAVRLREQVTRVVPAGASLLVNTHHHGDHVFGNAQFVPAATIVAHELTRTEMAAAGLGLRNLWPDVDWGDTPLVLPSLTFRDRLTLDLGGITVQLIHVGPAHTTNDVVAWIPQRRVLFAGDVLMSGVTPFCLMGSIEGSLRAIERLRALRPRIVVAGHGPVAGPEILDVNAAYLRWIQRVAAAGVSDGRSVLQAAASADAGEFADLLDSERLVGNLHRAYAELGGAQPGAPIDVATGFREMVTYHGGLPACHA